jgi:hypothetical protein
MGVLVLSSRCSWYVCWHEVDNTLGALDIRDARIQGLFLPAQARRGGVRDTRSSSQVASQFGKPTPLRLPRQHALLVRDRCTVPRTISGVEMKLHDSDCNRRRVPEYRS